MIAEVKMNKDRISIEGLKEKAKRLVAEYPKYQIQYLGLSVEDIGDYLKDVEVSGWLFFIA